MRYETFRPEVAPEAPSLSGVADRPFIRTPYNYDRDAVSVASGLAGFEPTLTQQQYKDECDINTIAKNFGVTGQLPVNVRMPTFGDFSDVEDFQTALNAGRRASQSFMQMPAEVRARFQNNPQLFLEFCSDVRNREEAVKLGLVEAPPISATIAPPVDAPKPM